jgi:hypothetical protein
METACPGLEWAGALPGITASNGHDAQAVFEGWKERLCRLERM